MTNDDFLKEKQNIREKMLKYSRAVKEGRVYEEHYELNESDRILKNRINRKKKPKFTDFDEEYEEKPKKQSSIYLKEDLINVKLEEKKPFSMKINFFKKNKQKTNKNNDTNTKKSIIKEKSATSKEKFANKSFQFEQISKIVTTSNAYVSLKIQNIKENQKQKAKLKQEIKEKKKLEKEKLQKQEQIEKEKLEKIQEEVKLQEQIEYNTEDKYELLDSIKTDENKNLSLKHLSYAGVILIFALLVFFPQIYIRNQIYYISRDIADLRSQEWVLDEENKELQRQLEAIYFQNQVLDYLD